MPYKTIINLNIMVKLYKSYTGNFDSAVHLQMKYLQMKHLHVSANISMWYSG